jgi:hypothetical protein
MTRPVRLRPARKYPSSVSSMRPRVRRQVRKATRVVKKRKEMTVGASILEKGWD